MIGKRMAYTFCLEDQRISLEITPPCFLRFFGENFSFSF
jgi:hypothetical protein